MNQCALSHTERHKYDWLNPWRWISLGKVSFFKFSLKWLGCYSIHLPNLVCADLWMCKFIPTLITSRLCPSDGLQCVSSTLLVPLYKVPWWKGIRTLTGVVVDYLVTFLTNVLLYTNITVQLSVDISEHLLAFLFMSRWFLATRK